MDASCDINWAGQSFTMFADKSLLWRQAAALIVTDPHFGKAAAFRVSGVPVPAGTTSRDLDRLTAALQRTKARRLIILGDFFHAWAGRTQSTMALLDAWRSLHPHLEITLLRGNHDQHAGDPPESWRITCVDGPLQEGRLAFCHEPCELAARYVIAGHVHPCVRLCDVDGSTERVACFLFGERAALLPAFGSFTGMHPIRPVGGDRIFAIGDGAVIAVPTRAPAASG